MNRKQIEAKLRKLCGKNAHYVVRDDAPDADARQSLLEAHREARRKQEAAQQRMDERTRALRQADAEYQAALAEWKDARKHMRETQHFGLHRIHAGRLDHVAGLAMFHVSAQGDTWPEVFAKLEAKQ